MEEQQVQKYVRLHTDCFNLPKIELHAHLNGSIRTSTLQNLLSNKELEDFTNIGVPKTYKEAFDMFKISAKILKDLNVIRRITREVIEDWSKQNCIYFELRTTPKAIGNTTKVDYITAILDEMQKCNEKYTMQTRLIISIDRAQTLEQAYETYDAFMSLKNSKEPNVRLIVGADYSGFEENEHIPHDELYKLFNKFRTEGLGITYHIGEIEKYQMIDFEKFKPDRLSHTYYLTDEDVAKIKLNKIPVEVCPTSTLVTWKKYKYSDIHFEKYFDRNKDENLVCINTDDTMILATNLSQEYFEIAMSHDMNIKDLKNVLRNTVKFIFISCAIAISKYS